MSFPRRALLYLARKRGKTLTLLLILFTVAVLALSSWSVRQAAQTAQLNVRQALGGELTLKQDEQDPSNWKNESVPGFGVRTVFAGTPIDVSLATRVVDEVDGIKGASASLPGNVLVPEREDGGDLELVEGEDADAGLAAALTGYGDFARTVQINAVTNSRWDSAFANGYLKLVEGEPITDGSGNNVLVSREFAEKNDLSVGDGFVLRRSEIHAQMSGESLEESRTPVIVAGIFEETTKSSAQLSNWSMANAMYTTMDVVDHARPGTAEEGYEQVSFYVDDPGELSRIADDVEKLPFVDGSGYAVDADTSEVDAVIGPLENVDRLVTVMAAASVAVGAVVLYLVLASRVRDRLHESGTLLCLGFTRASVVGQHLVEVLTVAALAFALAVPASAVASQAVGDSLLGYANAEAQQQDSDEGAVQSQDGMASVSSGDLSPTFTPDREMAQIEVRVTPESVGVLVGVGFAIAAGAVLLADARTMRMGPREIMSKLD